MGLIWGIKYFYFFSKNRSSFDTMPLLLLLVAFSFMAENRKGCPKNTDRQRRKTLNILSAFGNVLDKKISFQSFAVHSIGTFYTCRNLPRELPGTFIGHFHKILYFNFHSDTSFMFDHSRV